MSLCLCCGKEMRTETVHGWHSSCVKRFFGTSVFPEIDLSDETLNQIVINSTNKGFAVTGVQKKISLHLTESSTPRLTLVNYPTGYILKPQTEEYTALPEMEYLTMQMAQESGIKTVPFGLLRFQSQETVYAYITKRIDRLDGKMLAMEDFCQLDGRLTVDKYRGSYERCGKIIHRYSANSGLDASQMFLRIIFSFAVGNSDMHLKNFSLIEKTEGGAEYILSPAYDLLSTNVVIPEDQEQLALPVNGKKSNIRRKDFLVLAGTIGVMENAAEKMIRKIVSLKEKYIAMCRDSYLPEEMKESFEKLIEERMEVLSA